MAFLKPLKLLKGSLEDLAINVRSIRVKVIKTKQIFNKIRLKVPLEVKQFIGSNKKSVVCTTESC